MDAVQGTYYVHLERESAGKEAPTQQKVLSGVLEHTSSMPPPPLMADQEGTPPAWHLLVKPESDCHLEICSASSSFCPCKVGSLAMRIIHQQI